jgi:FKBP-type peptidyl-prolyl cis-trans isomerase
VGEEATVVFPPETAYGSAGLPPYVPANATLVYRLELVGISAR